MEADSDLLLSLYREARTLPAPEFQDFIGHLGAGVSD